MLTLDPASACEVCAETFGPGHVPAVIPCGHVFCAQCLATIVDKTSPRLTPACPLCRGTFSDKTWRLIRVDLGGSGAGSGWSGSTSDSAQDEGSVRVRADAKRLEDKVAQAASKKCSFEEVSALHKEVQEWLSHDTHSSKTDPQHAGLRLSADLLRAILLNCLAYSESTKRAKSREETLQTEVDNLRAELRRQRDLAVSKSQEAERLRDELNRLRPNNASKHTARPTSSSSTSTPPRPGTSLGFSSTSSARGMSTASGAAAASTTTTPTRPGSVAPRMYSSYTSPSPPTSPPRSESPETPAILPPAPLPSYISLAPSPASTVTSLAPATQAQESPSRTSSYASRNISLASQASRSQTPGPMMHRRTSSSHASIPARPSTAMGSRSQHERWFPTQAQSGIQPPLSRSSRFSSSRTSGFQVVEEAD